MEKFNGNYYDKNGNIRNLDGGTPENPMQNHMQPFNGAFYGSDGSIQHIEDYIGTDVDLPDPNKANKNFSNVSNADFLSKGTMSGLAAATAIPTALPTPNKLTFTGSVTGEFDGSSPLSVSIPAAGMSDAPVDSNFYARRNGSWVPSVDPTLVKSMAYPFIFQWVTNRYELTTSPIPNFGGTFSVYCFAFENTNPIDSPTVKIGENIYDLYINDQKPLANRLSTSELCFGVPIGNKIQLFALDTNRATIEEAISGLDKNKYITPETMKAATSSELSNVIVNAVTMPQAAVYLATGGGTANGTFSKTEPTVTQTYTFQVSSTPTLRNIFTLPFTEAGFISSLNTWSLVMRLTGLQNQTTYNINGDLVLIRAGEPDYILSQLTAYSFQTGNSQTASEETLPFLENTISELAAKLWYSAGDKIEVRLNWSKVGGNAANISIVSSLTNPTTFIRNGEGAIGSTLILDNNGLDTQTLAQRLRNIESRLAALE